MAGKKHPAAVIGVGQTHHRAKREDVSMPGLLREAIDRALEDAQMTLDEIDAIVVGKAPDLFEGCLLYTSPSPRDRQKSRMPSSA